MVKQGHFKVNGWGLPGPLALRRRACPGRHLRDFGPTQSFGTERALAAAPLVFGSTKATLGRLGVAGQYRIAHLPSIECSLT